jgi:hypothetical protein
MYTQLIVILATSEIKVLLSVNMWNKKSCRTDNVKGIYSHAHQIIWHHLHPNCIRLWTSTVLTSQTHKTYVGVCVCVLLSWCRQWLALCSIIDKWKDDEWRNEWTNEYGALVEWYWQGETALHGNLSQCYCVHQKIHVDWPGIELWPPKPDAGEWPSEPQNLRFTWWWLLRSHDSLGWPLAIFITTKYTYLVFSSLEMDFLHDLNKCIITDVTVMSGCAQMCVCAQGVNNV